MSKISLHELAGAYTQLENMTDGDIGETEFFAAIDAIDGALKDKATNIAMFIRNIEAAAESIKEAEGIMAQRRKALERRASATKEYILNNMLAAQITKIDCPLFTLSVRNNPPSVSIEEHAAIPADYLRQQEPPAPVPDKRKLLEDISKHGLVIDGVRVEQRKSLVIR